MIGEADMKKDEYVHINYENDAKSKFKEHMKLKTTCIRIKQVLEGIIFKKRDEAILDFEDITNAVCRMKFSN